MAKKTAKKKVTKKSSGKPGKKGKGNTTTRGVGKKLAIYVPKVDEWVIDRLEQIQKDRLKEGYRTSLSYELIRLVKERLQEM